MWPQSSTLPRQEVNVPASKVCPRCARTSLERFPGTTSVWCVFYADCGYMGEPTEQSGEKSGKCQPPYKEAPNDAA